MKKVPRDIISQPGAEKSAKDDMKLATKEAKGIRNCIYSCFLRRTRTEASAITFYQIKKKVCQVFKVNQFILGNYL